jgi:hypothetical protein
LRLEHLFQRPAHRGIVVDDQDDGAVGCWLGIGWAWPQTSSSPAQGDVMWTTCSGGAPSTPRTLTA